MAESFAAIAWPVYVCMVLDEKGVITHVFVSSVTYEDLRQAVEENLG